MEIRSGVRLLDTSLRLGRKPLQSSAVLLSAKLMSIRLPTSFLSVKVSILGSTLMFVFNVNVIFVQKPGYTVYGKLRFPDFCSLPDLWNNDKQLSIIYVKVSTAFHIAANLNSPESWLPVLPCTR